MKTAPATLLCATETCVIQDVPLYGRHVANAIENPLEISKDWSFLYLTLSFCFPLSRLSLKVINIY